MITLHDLNSHADLVIQLNTARQMLAAFQSAVLRASSIDGMPHAPSAGNGKVEALAIKLSDLEEDVKRREAAVRRSEPEIKSFIAGIQDPRLSSIFYLRFICGYEWFDVAATLPGRASVEAVKSACYRYLRSQHP
jgi:hypothetical protein